MPKPCDQECSSCQFFYGLDSYPEDGGECRKNAPIHVDDDGYGHWPSVNGDWWCGAWHIVIEDSE